MQRRSRISRIFSLFVVNYKKRIGDLECEKTYPFVSDYSIFSLKI